MMFPWIPTTLLYFYACVRQGDGACWYDIESETQGHRSDVSGYINLKDSTACQEFCSSQPRCVAAEFMSDTNGCYIYNGPTTLQLNVNAVFMQRKCIVDTTTARPVSTSMESTSPTPTTEMLTMSTTTTPLSPSTRPQPTTSASVPAATTSLAVPPTHRHTTTTVQTSSKSTTSTPPLVPTTQRVVRSSKVPPVKAPPQPTPQSVIRPPRIPSYYPPPNHHMPRYGHMPYYELSSNSQSFRNFFTPCIILLQHSIFTPVASSVQRNKSPFRLVNNSNMNVILCLCNRPRDIVRCPRDPIVLNINLPIPLPATRIPATTPTHDSKMQRRREGRRKTSTRFRVNVRHRLKVSDTRVCLNTEDLPRPPTVVVVSFLDSGEVVTDPNVPVAYPGRSCTNLTLPHSLHIPPPLLLFTGNGSRSQLRKIYTRYIRQLNMEVKQVNGTSPKLNNITLTFANSTARRLKESIRVSKVVVKFRKKGFSYILRGRMNLKTKKRQSFLTDT